MRGMVLIHRYLGILMGIVVLMWFATGIVMVYVPFPQLTLSERLAQAAPLNLSNCCAPMPWAAWPRVPVQARLFMVDGDPAWVVRDDNGEMVAFSARTGEMRVPVPPEVAQRIARVHAGGREAAHAGILRQDQWTVSDSLNPYRPLHRLIVSDSAGTHLYVSQRTGEVVRDTTFSERAWNYVGAVLHWIYPSALRQAREPWRLVVMWISGAALVVALSGVILGLQRLVRQGGWRGSPYRGWMKWHHWAGLVLSLPLLTWLFSGWLSVDPWRLFSIATQQEKILADYAGGSADASAFLRSPAEVLQSLPASEQQIAKEIVVRRVGGRAIYLVWLGDGRVRHLDPSMVSPPADGFRVDELVRAAQRALPDSKARAEELERGDAYYYATARSSRPLPVLRVMFQDDVRTALYIDPTTGQIEEVLTTKRRVYRWLFNALHSWDWLPRFVQRRVWEFLIVTACAAGALFALTGVVIGYRRLSKSIGRALPYKEQ